MKICLQNSFVEKLNNDRFFSDIFGGLECVGHSFAYVVHFVFSRDVWLRTQRVVVASRRAIDLAMHPSP
jgi:hypothetical protein